jgi:hypothetical protein
MTLTIILVCCLPVALIFVVIFAIGTAASRTYRGAKRSYGDVKPYFDNLSAQAARIQSKGTEFADRGQKLTATIDEIGGRWAFIAEAVREVTTSPVVKLADYAGKFTSKK